MFKISDESQLGGLSSLLAGAAGAWSPVPKPPKKRYLEEAATPLAAWEGTSSDLAPPSSPSQPGPSAAAPDHAAPNAPETNNNEASYTNGKFKIMSLFMVD